MWLPGWNCPNCRSQDAGGTVLEDRAVYPYRIFKVKCARCAQASLWAYKETFAGWLRILAGVEGADDQSGQPAVSPITAHQDPPPDLEEGSPSEISEDEMGMLRQLLDNHRGSLTELFGSA